MIFQRGDDCGDVFIGHHRKYRERAPLRARLRESLREPTRRVRIVPNIENDFDSTARNALKASRQIRRAQPGDPLIAVFMPCTPNPTTGFLMYVHRSEIVFLDMSIEDGAKLIVSAGLVAPEYRPKARTPDGRPIDGPLGNPRVAEAAKAPRPVRSA